MKGRKNYSVAEARDNLARLVHDAEKGQTVEITRRGKAVAVILSLEGYQRLTRASPTLWEAILEFREAHGIAAQDLDPDEVFAVDRKIHRDRDVEL